MAPREHARTASASASLPARKQKAGKSRRPRKVAFTRTTWKTRRKRAVGITLIPYAEGLPNMDLTSSIAEESSAQSTKLVPTVATTKAGLLLRHRFELLARRWERDTMHVSSTSRIVAHPDFQKIIGLGPQVIPLVLARLRRGRAHWAWALSAITHEDPVPSEAAGDMRQIRQRWLDLAKQKGWSGDDAPGA